MVLFFLALLALPSPAAAPAESCAAVDAAFVAAREAYVRTDLEARERALRAARALHACPGVAADRRSFAMTWEAYVLGHLRRYEEQLAVLDAFIAEPSLHGTTRRALWAYDARAWAHRHLGRPLDALSQYHVALAHPDGLAPDLQAGLMLDLSRQYSNLGEQQQRQYWIERALALLDPETHPSLYARALERQATAITLVARRSVPHDVAALRQAEAIARQSISVAQQEPDVGARQEVLSQAYRVYADVLNRLGKYEGSLEAAETALRLGRQADPHDAAPHWWSGVGTGLVRTGRIEEGIAAFEEALRLAEANHRDYLPVSYYLLGWGYAQAGHDRAAERHFRAGIAAMEARRLELGLSSWNAQAFTETTGYYQELIALLLREGRSQEAFETLDASRARLLRDLRRYARLHDLSPADRSAHDALRDEISATYAALRTADATSAARLSAEAARLEADLARLTGHTPTLEAPALAEIQQLLARDGRTVLTYFLGRNDSPSDPPVAFVVTATSFDTVPLGVSRDSLSVWVREATAGLGDSRTARTVEASAFQKLYDVLFRPVEHLVPEGAPVTLIPEGALHALPFGMLLDGPAAPYQYHAWPYLLRRHPLSTMPAAALLAEPPPSAARTPLVAFGRSRFAGASPPAPFAGPPPPALPHVPAELAALRRHVPNGSFALDEQATPDALRALIADAHVLHLASHTYVSAEDPLFSAILLYGQGSGGDALYLHELLGRQIDAALVVLSGCDSALGRTLAGEGVSGLHSAFQSAGARASLATLWAVDDEATSALMDRFYAYLARGLPKDRALQRAQLDFLHSRSRLDASPYFWAGLALSGDPAPVAWGRSGPPAWAWVLGGLLLLSAAVATGRLRFAPRLTLGPLLPA